MFYRIEETLDDFQFWGAAMDVIDQLIAYDDEHGTNHYNEVAKFADDLFNEGEDYTKTDVNDWVAFDVPSMLGESWSEVFE